ncbi:hypothetical protein [Actinomadura formosensis]|uniref:hypothetical protein n=1 Tax=Actinomadura formosensis TaxID=60706 RepID=UPI003D917974
MGVGAPGEGCGRSGAESVSWCSCADPAGCASGGSGIALTDITFVNASPVFAVSVAGVLAHAGSAGRAGHQR